MKVSTMGMIDISRKDAVKRRATAEGVIELDESTIKKIKEKEVKKGDPLQVAEISAIQAVKKTPDNIPHCHPIPIEGVSVDIKVMKDRIVVSCEVKAIYKTGVEMEAISGVNAALLTIWDMVKYLEKDEEGQYPDTKISGIKVVEKVKGD
ncbi:MAG: cyclic pyranopterin monophosphate synthase MoaC [Thermoplasmatota archaeon]